MFTKLKAWVAAQTQTAINDAYTEVAVGGALGTGALFQLKAKPVSKHQTVADRLDWLCAQYKGRYERTTNPDGVVVRFIQDDGDTITSGRGATTGAAVAELMKKLGAIE